MVSSTARQIISLAISLLIVVISLTDVALGATAPTVTKLSRYTPGFAGAPGKMARDAAGNFYVTDFWGKGIVRLDRQGVRAGFIPTLGRPSAVAVLPDNRLVVAMTAPQPYIAFYSQTITARNETTGAVTDVTGEEISPPFGAPLKAYFRPTGITVDGAGFIYTVDSGDSSSSPSVNVGTVRVYSPTGEYLYRFGERTTLGSISTTPGYFKQPMGIAYEKQSNQIVVVDTMNSRLQFFKAWNVTPGTCEYVTSIGTSMWEVPSPNAAVTLGDPTDVAFEYSGVNLSRMYVTERSRNEIAVVDMTAGSPTYGYDLKRINGTTVIDADMKQPSGVVFEKTTTGVGVLYASNAATSNQANILALSIDGGAVPEPVVTLKINAIAPTVTLPTLSVSGTVSPVNAVTCSANGDGTDVTAPLASNWTTSSNLTLQSGANYILCKSTSGGITTYAEANTYYTGSLGQAPTVTISQPSAGIFTNASKVTVSGTSDTANATVQLVNGLNSYTVFTQTDATNNWSAAVDLAAGSNLITVSVWKQGTNTGSATVTVNADYTDPGINLSFLSDAKTTNIAVQNLDGIVTEANLSKIEVNGAIVPATAMVTTGSNTYFSVPVTLVRGENAVTTVKATDLAGNFWTTTTGTVTLNPELPGLAVDLPGDNSYMNAAGSPAASGSIDPIFANVNIPGSSLTPTAGTWSGSFPTTPGFNTYEFTATGGSTAVTLKRSINTDVAYTKLAITSPAADRATGSSSITVSGSVAPGSARPQISITGIAGGNAVDVETYVSGTGAFSHPVDLSLLGQGLHTVKVIANAATVAVRNIIYDTALPEITIQADSKISPTTISGLIDPSAKISTITASLGTGTPFTIPVSVLTFDTYNQAAGSVVWHADLNGYTYDTVTFTTVSPALNEKSLIRQAGIPTGDVDGDGVVRLSDALAALRHVAGTENLSGNKKFQADVGQLVAGRAGQDGVVDITDAVLILGKSYGLLSF